MHKISDKCRSRFAEVNARFGLDANESTHDPIHKMEKQTKGPIYFSSDPLASSVKPYIVHVASIAHYKDLVGITKDYPDDNVDYPPTGPGLLAKEAIFTNSPDRTTLINSLTPEQHKTIERAAHAYVLGDAEKVKPYEAMINAVHFPAKMAIFASEDPLEISTPVVISGPDPVHWNYPAVIMKDGGSIRQEGNVQFHVDTSSIVSEKADGNFNISSKPADYTPAKNNSGVTGKPGTPSTTKGADGTDSYSNSTCKWSCTTGPGKGGTGGPGGNGTGSSAGNKGTDMSPSTWHAGDVKGTLIIVAQGGRGQDGGDGGNGGPGGTGGPGGKPSPNKACGTSSGSQGDQGPGGDGSPGGKGGDGGDGSTITIYYKSLGAGINQDGVVQGPAGTPGASSSGGAGGTGTGANKPGGANGTAGTKPVINAIQIS